MHMIKRGSASAAEGGEVERPFSATRGAQGGRASISSSGLSRAEGRTRGSVRSSEEPGSGRDVGVDRNDGVETGHVAEQLLGLRLAARVVLREEK